MTPERAQMLREIRREYCKDCKIYPICNNPGECDEFAQYLTDLTAEAESQTEPENKNG